ncbi:MAG: MCE family protein [Jatrophihabitans sp.]|uniref:MCE family protein n=1 Tax=Jatrophihabitans sp. TaxID=1932789 RepID=UPI003F7E477E
MAEKRGGVIKQRLLGVVFLAVLVGLIGLSIAIYNKAFTPTVDIKLDTDHTGNSLIQASDVKLRGIIVGTVTGTQSKGDGAVVSISLEPSRVKDIPKNVTAQILPKTLFGEQYVSLNIPANPSPQHISEGDVIPQDRSTSALEAEKVIGDLLPILQAVKPAELNATLTSVATALSGRGTKLGQTIVNLNSLLKDFNPHTQQLADDLDKLGQNADLYNSVAPQLFDTLNNLKTTSTTITAKSAALDSLLTTATDTSSVLQSFLAENKERLIRLVGSQDSISRLLNQYAPEQQCLVNGIAHLYDLAASVIQDHQINLSATIDTTGLGKYKPGEQPRTVTGYGPSCFGLPNPPVPFQIPDKYKCLNDGAALTKDPCAAKPSYDAARALNSPEEKVIVNSIIAQSLGEPATKVPSSATVLAAPLLRGTSVVLK